MCSYKLYKLGIPMAYPGNQDQTRMPSFTVLFLIVMTIMFNGILHEDTQNLQQHRVIGTNFDEVLYADDTICANSDTKTMNKLLASLETEGRKYGLNLNKRKNELISTANNPNVHFADGTRVPQVDEVIYLGCNLNNTCNTSKELKSRIAACMEPTRTSTFLTAPTKH